MIQFFFNKMRQKTDTPIDDSLWNFGARLRRKGLPVFMALALAYSAPGQKVIQNITFETKSFRYEITQEGKNVSFIDKASGLNYYDAQKASYASLVMKDGKEYPASKATLKGGILYFEYAGSHVSAEIVNQSSGDTFTWAIRKVKGDPESITFLNIPLVLKATPDEPFGACALSMNLQTQVSLLPPLHNQLSARCYKEFGIAGGKVTVLAVSTPKDNILPAIRNIMKKASSIPFSDEGGAWALTKKTGYGSYLMNFGTLTEETVDEWIANCKMLGFNQIDLHGGSDFFRFGDLALNPKKWPQGWDNFKRINQRLIQAGIVPILHTYAFFIDKKSAYVTPIPDKGLAFFSKFTLTKPIDTDDDEIFVNESTADISSVTGFFERNSVTLRIGDELVSFSGVTTTAPFKFTGCKRGILGTKVAKHNTGAKAHHLKECFDLFVPDPDSLLFKTVAMQTAKVADENHFGGLYFDAIDGSDILGNKGSDNAWYYGTKFIFEVAKHLKRPIGMEMSAMWHHFWHYRTRWQAWDKPIRGQKTFIDLHLQSIQSPSLMLPMHVGWWENKTWDPPQTERSFVDQIDYLGAKMIGHNAGLSMLKGVDKNSLKENPLLAKLASRMKEHEDLRHQNYFSEEVRSKLREPGKEFALFKQDDNSWNFRSVTYKQHKISGNDASSSKWVIDNEQGVHSPKFRIEALMSVPSYEDPENIPLTALMHPEDFKKETVAGVDGVLSSSSEKTNAGESSWVLSSKNNGSAAVNGSWLNMEARFDTLRNLDKHQGLGVWVKGDGNGQLLNLGLQGAQHLSFGARADRYIKIDFTGWKYFELVEFESSRSRDYQWPFSGNLYASFFFRLDFKSVEKLQVWHNGLPKEKEVRSVIGPIKALPLISATTKNPTITVNNNTVVLPVELESGMYIEFNSMTDCKLYGSKGEFLKEITPQGTIPQLRAGSNDIGFNATSASKGINLRTQITIICEGKTLK